MPKPPPKPPRAGVRPDPGNVASAARGPGARTLDGRQTLAAVGLLTLLLLVLHGRFLTWPFVSDDFVFLAASRNIGQLFTSFDVYSNYFRPIGRELYFFLGYLLARNHPAPYHVANFLLLIGVTWMVVRLGERLAGARVGLLAGAAYALLYSHRLVMAWVSCSQDLLAACFALVATHALLSGRHVRAGFAHLLAMLSKESVAAFPLVVALWRALDAPAGTPWRERVLRAARGSAALWAATGAWAVIVLAARTARHAWARNADAGSTLADVTLTASSLWEGFRSALLSYVALEQPWSALAATFADLRPSLATLAWACVPLAAVVWWSARYPPRPARPGAGGAWRFALLWAVVGATPIALAGHHYSAYYVTFSGIGFALLVGFALARVTPAFVAASLALLTTLGLAANRVDLFNFARMEPEAGVSFITISRFEYERRFLDSLHVALERAQPTRGGVAYLSHAPRYTRFVTMDGRAPKVWFDDPGLDLKMVSDYVVGDRRPHVFLRFDADTRGFVRVPNAVMDASLAAETAMEARHAAEARAHLERGLALVPAADRSKTHLDLLHNLGTACAAMGDTAAARASWRRALALDPSFVSAALSLAGLDARDGDLPAARRALESFLDRTPDAAEVLSLLVRVQRAQGDLAAAEATLVRLSARDPAGAARLRSEPPPSGGPRR